MVCLIRPLREADKAEWLSLAEGYKAFYNTPLPAGKYDVAWSRLLAGDGVHGLGAEFEGRLVGIAHYLFHTSPWAVRVCYLEDLFVSPPARGKGAARELIHAVGGAAKAAGATRCYWSTHEDNAEARRLYDQVARHAGFIRYDYALRNSGEPDRPPGRVSDSCLGDSMTEARTTLPAQFMVIARTLAAEDPGVSIGADGKKGFGASALKVGGKIFAMVSSDGAFVVKLPKGRVDELEAAGQGRRFDPGHGRLMKEWLALDPGSSQDRLALAREALRFVGGAR